MQCSEEPIEGLRLQVLDGTLPDTIGGSAFLSGPRATIGSPIWGSEAVLWRLQYQQDGVVLDKQFVRNPPWYANRAIEEGSWFDGLRKGAFRFVDAGSGFHMSRILGVQDMQNIAPIPLSPELMLVTSDNGRPWTVDPSTMEVQRPVGWRADWKPGMPLPWPFAMVVTTAHPVLDEDGSLYTTNFLPKAPVIPSFTHVAKWNSGSGAMEHFQLLDADTGQPLVIQETLHQLQVTKNHVVLLESAFRVNFWTLILNGLTHLGVSEWLLDALTADADYPFARFWVVDKSELEGGGGPDAPKPVVARGFPIAGEGWHFAADYEDDDGLRIFVLHTPTADISHYLGEGQPMLDGSKARAELDGWFTNYGLRPGSVGVHRIDLDSGDVTSAWLADEKFTWGLGVHAYRYLEKPWKAKLQRIFINSGGFYRGGVPKAFYDLYAARAPRVDELPVDKPASVFALDPIDRTIDGWNLPEGWISWVPTYLPPVVWEGGQAQEQPKVATTEGFLMVVAVSDPTPDLPEGSSGTEIWIFDAGDIAKGPVCRLGHPDLTVGLAVHSCWVGTEDGYGPGPAWDVKEDYDLDAMRQAYESIVPDWLPGKRLARWGLRKWVRWSEIAELFETEIYPRF